MLSCVSRWSSRVSVHSSHSGWSTSVWPDMMSNRSLVTLVGYDQRQSLFGFVTQIIHREINACLSPSVYDWGFPWCRHQMHLQWVWSCWRSLLTSFWGKARHSRLSNSVSFVGHASKKKKKKRRVGCSPCRRDVFSRNSILLVFNKCFLWKESKSKSQTNFSTAYFHIKLK